MSTYLEQARRLADEDWLAREPYHPYHLWQRFAPEEKWRSWHPPHVFNQAPGYAYLLASARVSLPRGEETVRLLQCFLGGATAVLIFLTARETGGNLAAWIAGSMAALYGPFIPIERQYLREGPSLFLMLAAIWVTARLLQTAKENASARKAIFLFVFGSALFGVLTMFHEIGRIVFFAAFLSAGIYGASVNRKRMAILMAAMTGGYLLGFSPLLIRNLIVGAPLFSLSDRYLMVFAMSNDAHAPGGGARWGMVWPGLAVLMDEARGSFWRMLRAVIQSYGGKWELFAANWSAKFRGVCAVYEAPDNVSYDFYRLRVPLLRWLPDFRFVFAPGIGGMALAARDFLGTRKDTSGKFPETENFPPKGALTMLLIASICLIGSLSLTHAVGRWRLFVVPLLMIFASQFFERLISFVGRQDGLRKCLRAPAVWIFVASAAFQSYAQRAIVAQPLRPQDFIVAGNLEREEGQTDQAIEDYSKAIELGARTPQLENALRLLRREKETREISASARPAQPADLPPNILVLLPDQMRGEAMGCTGNPDVKTPELDRLASQGILLTNMFANTPVCCPARATILTGKYPHRHGLICNDLRLRESEITLAEILRDHGYRTGFIGKWHLDGGKREPGFVPPGERRQGFDFWAANECDHTHFKNRYFRDDPTPIEMSDYETRVWSDLAIEFLKQKRGAPFFLEVAMGPPHNPYKAPGKYATMYDPEKIALRPNWQPGADGRKEIAQYYGMISDVDEQCGRILRALDELGLAENTVVLFTSDHGDMLGSHGLRYKRKPWEESIHIPGILRFPARIAAEQKLDLLFSHVDIAPTLLGLCGIEIPSAMQGHNLAPRLLGQSKEEPTSILFQIFNPAALDGIPHPWRGIRTKTQMFARFENAPWVLYDLPKDPYELHNLADDPISFRERERMDQLLKDAMNQTRDAWSFNSDEQVEDGARLYREKAYYSIDDYLRESSDKKNPQ